MASCVVAAWAPLLEASVVTEEEQAYEILEPSLLSGLSFLGAILGMYI